MMTHETGPSHSEPTHDEIVDAEIKRLGFSETSNKRFAAQLRELAENPTTSRGYGHAAYEKEAAARIEQLDRFQALIGLVAPGGTAPRTALEQIYQQSLAGNNELTQIILDLGNMLYEHWAEWTPALRAAEGFPPENEDET